MKISQQKNLIYHLYSCKRSNHTYCISNSDEQVWEGRLNRVALKVQSDLDHHCVSFKMLLYPEECHSFSSAEIYFYSNPTFSKKLFQDYLSVKPFGSRSSLRFCQTWSWLKLFAKVISRWHQKAKSWGFYEYSCIFKLIKQADKEKKCKIWWALSVLQEV